MFSIDATSEYKEKSDKNISDKMSKRKETCLHYILFRHHALLEIMKERKSQLV